MSNYKYYYLPDFKIKWAQRQLINLQLSQNNKVKYVFDEFIRTVSPELKKYTNYSKKNIWKRNASVEKFIDSELTKLHAKLVSIIEQGESKAAFLSFQNNDEYLKTYLKRMSIFQVAAEGIFMRSLEGFSQFKKKYSKLNYSKRIWDLAAETKTQLEFFMSSGLAAGRSAAEISRDVRGILKEPDKRFRRIKDPKTGKLKLSKPMKDYHPGQGVYRSSFKNALRLTGTNINISYRQADVFRWQKEKFVLGYEVRLSGNHPVFDICDSMVGKYPKTFVFTGWHSNCFCYATPILPEPDNFVKYLGGKKDFSNDYVLEPPKKHTEFFNNHIERYDKNYKELPYWVDHNYTKVNGVYRPKFQKSGSQIENMGKSRWDT